MATYREIHGKAVKSLDTDPTAETDAGQIWYNTGSDTFKSIVNVEAWASSASMSLARYNTGSFGIQGDGVVAGNDGTYVTTTEEYNGSGWSSGGALGTGRGASAGAGIASTAGLIFGGFQGTANQVLTESYNGSSFSEVADLSTGRRILASAVQAPQTAGLAFGGYVTAASTATEEWGGSSWTSGGALPTAKYKHAGAGTQTAGLSFGGIPAPGGAAQTTTEEYDGSSWTSGGALGTAAEKCAGSGTQTLALCFGGPPDTDLTQKYDGTTWSNAPTLGTGRGYLMGMGTGTAALAFGGHPPTVTTTEEFTNSANVITAAAWASGGTMPAAYYGFSAFAGTQTAGIALGGKTPPGDQATILKYDGTSWTANPSNLNTARRSGASVGTQTATLLAGGVTGSTTFKNEAEEFNGSSAAAQTALPYSGSSNFGFGTQTAAVIAGGYAPPFPTLASTNVEYNGSSWTAATALPAARGLGGSAGQAQTTGLVWAGLSPSAVDTTLEYDGTNWTSGGTYLESKSNLQGFGDQTSAISGGGEPDVSTCAGYDGTAWSTRPSLPGTRKQAGSGGSSNTSGLMFGGETPPITDTTIEFTGETTAVNVETLTQS